MGDGLHIHNEVFVLNNSNLPKAMDEIRRAFEVGNWSGVVIWREQIQSKLHRERYWTEARQINEWAIEAAHQLGELGLVARFTHDLADMNSQQGYYAKAENLYQHSFEIYEQQLNDFASATKSLHMLALAKRALGKQLEAETLAYKCFERAERFDMEAWRAHPLHLLAWLTRDRGNYDKAFEYLTEALRIHEGNQEHDRSHMLAQSHYDIARVLIMAGKLLEAEAHISEAITLSQIGDIQRIGYMAAKLYGDLALSQGLPDKALKYYYHALDRAQTGPDERRVAEIYLDLARVYLRLKQPRKSASYFRSGISQLRRLKLLTLSRLWSEVTQIIKTLNG